jgi:hypothetical protein
MVEVCLELHVCKQVHAKNNKHKQEKQQQTSNVQNFWYGLNEGLEVAPQERYLPNKFHDSEHSEDSDYS